MTYTVTTAGGVSIRVQGQPGRGSQIEREFTLLLGESVTVTDESEASAEHEELSLALAA